MVGGSVVVVGGTVVVVDPRTGEVLAMVGGRSYADSQFNRAVEANRHPGSTFKLFVYLAALRQGFVPQDVVDGDVVGHRGLQHGRVDRYAQAARGP